jgi:glycosyltransferase involved in cell wall biosynthesis
MRIAFIAPYPPAHDGIGNYSQLLGDELVRQGHELGVLWSRDSGATPPEVIEVMPGARESIEPALAAIDRFGPDIVHVQFAFSTYGARVRNLIRILDRLRRGGRRVVVTFHEITRDLDSLGAFGIPVYRRIAHRADRVLVHTETARELYLETIGASPACELVAHPRAELPTPTVTEAQLRDRHGLGDDRVVLSFGFIQVDKGISDLLLAAGRLRRGDGLDGVRIVIAGEVRRRYGILRPFELRDRLYLRQLEQIISREGLAEHVVFTGYVPNGEVRSWFDVAAVAVLPYRRIEQSGAGSLARSAGTPLLTTDVGELARLSTFPPVPPEDPTRLADALEQALGAVRSGAQDDRAQDNLTEIVTQTTAIYTEIVVRTGSVA